MDDAGRNGAVFVDRGASPMKRVEEVRPVGYINGHMKHVLITIRDPTLVNGGLRRDFVQVAITIESAIVLRAELNAFLKEHDVREN